MIRNTEMMRTRIKKGERSHMHVQIARLTHRKMIRTRIKRHYGVMYVLIIEN